MQILLWHEQSVRPQGVSGSCQIDKLARENTTAWTDGEALGEMLVSVTILAGGPNIIEEELLQDESP